MYNKFYIIYILYRNNYIIIITNNSIITNFTNADAITYTLFTNLTNTRNKWSTNLAI